MGCVGVFDLPSGSGVRGGVRGGRAGVRRRVEGVEPREHSGGDSEPVVFACLMI